MNSSATIIMAAALACYSVGVWGEKFSSRLKWWHFVFFVLGLTCDTWGTGMMFDFVGGMTLDIHGITGVIAIVLMLVHALWALIVLIKKNEKAIRNFHKFSIVVWVIWLIPYLSPMFLGMAA